MKLLRRTFSCLFVLILTACSGIPVSTASPESATAVPSVITETATPGDFTLTSPDVSEGGYLPVEYTCDGEGACVANYASAGTSCGDASATAANVRN